MSRIIAKKNWCQLAALIQSSRNSAAVLPRTLSTAPTKTWQQEHLEGPQAGAPIPHNISKRQRRIIFRSKQRGWLELDIIMGGWAAKNVPKMHDEQSIAKIEHLLNADTPDVLNWVLGHQEPPEEYQNDVMHSLRAYAGGEGHVNDR